MAKVFVSHASADKDRVDKLCDLLDYFEIDYWISSKHIKSSQNWNTEIEKAMDQAEHVLVVVSQQSKDSEYVQAEWQTALDKKNQKMSIPLLLKQMLICPFV